MRESTTRFTIYVDEVDIVSGSRHMDNTRSGSNKALTLASEVKTLRAKWQTLSIYERFEQTVVALLTFVIAIIIALAVWQLLANTLRLLGRRGANPADPQVFQSLFGMVLTVLIALEFKHTLLVVKHHRRAIVQARAVVLIALLALVRRFMILDLYQTTPTMIATLAGASLALGVVFWLVGSYEPREEDVVQWESRQVQKPLDTGPKQSHTFPNVGPIRY